MTDDMTIGQNLKNSTSARSADFSRLDNCRSNLCEAELVETAIKRNEGRFAVGGALVCITGSHTGRSPKDKFVVKDDATADRVWWENSSELSKEQFDILLDDFLDHAEQKELFVQDLHAGADKANRLNVRVYCEFAWHALFIRHLLRRPARSSLVDFEPGFTIIDLPSFKADPKKHGCRTSTVIACDFTRRIVLIGGTAYAGEIKKSVFTFLNYALIERGIMPMHCSANIGKDGDTAVFFGLSGTGKTTLSADPDRQLIGDDEHGWGDNGVFNFEGGCYAKTVRLSAEAEPEIFAATRSFSCVLENVVLDEHTRTPDFDNITLTENTRCAYPLEFISNAELSGLGGHPKYIIMLTADAFGVLPPIARLTPEQAMYHFLSGYTAKVAGTERGVTEPEATFSTCFGAPFMPRHPSEYGNLLRKKMAETGAHCWLVNTGWTGGPFGVGHRMPIKVTRSLLSSALSGQLDHVNMRRDPLFGFEVPVDVSGIQDDILDPRSTWSDGAAYDVQANKLAQMFNKNFAQFASYVDSGVNESGPKAK